MIYRELRLLKRISSVLVLVFCGIASAQNTVVVVPLSDAPLD